MSFGTLLASEQPTTGTLRGVYQPLLSDQNDPSTLRRAAIGSLGVAAVLIIGLLDYLTGLVLFLGVFYVLVVVGVTLSAGAGVGALTAMVTGLVWGTADAFIRGADISIWIELWNGLLRSVVLGIVVLLETALLRALRASQQSEARTRSFLASAAHQLRTPVAAVSASVEALLMEGSSPTQEQLLANLTGEVGRLRRLITSLLRAARLDEGEPTHPQRIDLVDLCTQELERFRSLNSLEWRLSVDDRAPRQVWLDPDATRESLANLLDNASRHARSAVDVRVSVERGKLLVRVADDGGGLPGGDEERAFGRFVTLDGHGGSGLGLSIARDLTRRQGGELSYVEGTFVLAFPLGTIEEDRPAVPPERRSRRLVRRSPPVA